jgi:hypothetical protein
MQPLTLTEIRSLDIWHLELANLQDAFNRAYLDFVESSDPASYGSLFHVLDRYFLSMVESFPMPSRLLANAEISPQSCDDAQRSDEGEKSSAVLDITEGTYSHD